jgi:hypothetical protein
LIKPGKEFLWTWLTVRNWKPDFVVDSSLKIQTYKILNEGGNNVKISRVCCHSGWL